MKPDWESENCIVMAMDVSWAAGHTGEGMGATLDT